MVTKVNSLVLGNGEVHNYHLNGDVFGGGAGQAVEGNETIVFTATGSLTGGGTVTLGNGGNITFNYNEPTNVSHFTNDAQYTSVGDGLSVFTNNVGYVVTGSNISVFSNDVGYITGSANVSIFNNDANYVSSGSNISIFVNDSGYLTTETDPTVGTHIKAITTTEISNWNAAYSWGDHGLEGYLIASDTDDISEGTTNLYYTKERVEDDMALILVAGNNITIAHDDIANTITISGAYPDLSFSDTDDLAEGVTNLYYTDARVDARIPTNISSFTNDSGYLTSYTETDPIFAASPAGGILAGDITNWNTAYGWGDHSLAGYLTSYTETQTLQDVTDIGAITTNAISITNATGSTAYTNGALTVGGGVGVAENLYVNGTINGSEVNLSYTDFAGIANASAPAYQEGRMYYDTDAKTLVLYGNNSGFEIPLGEREWVRVRNSSGATIYKGQPVYATGVHIAGHPIHGHHPTVALADASDVNKIEVLGLAAHDIADTAHGYVIVRGYIDNIDTSTLTTGSRVHLGFASPGTIIDNAPGYPNYPVDLGLALTSNASTGTIYVDVQTHTFEELRLTNNGRVDGNWTVGGNLTVNGTTSIIGTTNLAVSNNFIYLNSGDTIGEANTLFTGSGLDDGSLNGHYTGTTTKTFYVRIDSVGGGTGGVDTFEWSLDNFSTTVATGIDVSMSPTSLSDNITVMWEATTGHTLNATWYGTAAPSNVDNAIIGNRNTGATGVGYTHIGLFFDVSDEKWKLFSEYDPEPTGSINTADASFNLGILAASAFEGNLTGNVTGDVTGNLSGNATTASAWATGRTLTLSGDVTGTSAAFNGSGNISISTTIAPNSVALGTDTTGNYAGSITAGAGISVTGAAGEGTAYTIAHSDTSTATNLTASSRTYVTGLTFDTYGHVQSYTTGTETATDTHWTSKNIIGATNTATANAAATNGNVWINHLEQTSVTSAHKISGSGATSVTSDASGNITISSTDTNTTDWRVASSGGTQFFAVNATDHVRFIGTGATSVSFDAATKSITYTSTDTDTWRPIDDIPVDGNSTTSISSNWAFDHAALNSAHGSTSANTASRIVERDASGNFSAGTITASLSGNATSADKWSTGRTITLTGDVTGVSGVWDGSSNISFATTIAANSVALGTDTTGNYVSAVAVSGNGLGLTGTAGEGWTATVTSNATSANTANTIVYRDASGNFSAGVINATVTQARYADLAEKYTTKHQHPVGTVMMVSFEEDYETTSCSSSGIPIGIISENPAFLMNETIDGQAIALKGRVPVRVVGQIRKGEAVYAYHNGCASKEFNGMHMVGIALETNNNEYEKLVECVIKI